LELDRDSHEVRRDGTVIALTPTEFRLLRFLMLNAGRVLGKGHPVPEAALVPLGVDAGPRKERARQALAEVGLDDRARHLPSELSGGQQQRVAIARALIKKPAVLLADEPTGNLDEGTRDEIMTLLEDLWRERGLTLVTVTYDSSVARRAQQTAVMRNGLLTIRASAPPGTWGHNRRAAWDRSLRIPANRY
jgi:putative ABC transport system ATP-binding protein